MDAISTHKVAKHYKWECNLATGEGGIKRMAALQFSMLV